MAEWLCRGLQILVQRFDSASGLQSEIACRTMNVGPAALVLNEIDDPIDVVAFVTEHGAAGDGLVDELTGCRHIVRLTGSERQPQR